MIWLIGPLIGCASVAAKKAGATVRTVKVNSAPVNNQGLVTARVAETNTGRTTANRARRDAAAKVRTVVDKAKARAARDRVDWQAIRKHCVSVLKR